MASSTAIQKIQEEIQEEIEKANAQAAEHKRLAEEYEKSSMEAALQLQDEEGAQLDLPDKPPELDGDRSFYPQEDFPHFFNEPYFWKEKAEKQFHDGQNGDEDSDPQELLLRLGEARKAQLEANFQLGKQNTIISQLRQRKFELELQKKHRDKVVMEKQRMMKTLAAEIAQIRGREDAIQAEINARKNFSGDLERQKKEIDYQRKKKEEYLYDLEQSALALEAQCLDIKDVNQFIRSEEDLLIRQAKHLREQQEEARTHQRRAELNKIAAATAQEDAAALHSKGTFQLRGKKRI